jgi:hypothetical protein
MSSAARRRATCAQVHTLVLQVSNPSGGGLKKVGGRALALLPPVPPAALEHCAAHPQP